MHDTTRGLRLDQALSWATFFATLACSRYDASWRGQAPASSSEQTVPLSQRHGAERSERTVKIEEMFEERSEERENLVRRYVAGAGIVDERVLAAMRRVPRHYFVPEVHRSDAYQDHPLPIGWGQTISQPYIVAFMTQSARIRPTDRCLEIGTGSGYQAAVLAEVCQKTYSVEYLAPLAEFARSNLASLGYDVQLRVGNGYGGWPEAAPFDVILVTAAPERVPQPLFDQLALNGRLVVPVGPSSSVQQLELWTRIAPGSAPNAFQRQDLADVRFVPFLGNGS